MLRIVILREKFRRTSKRTQAVPKSISMTSNINLGNQISLHKHHICHKNNHSYLHARGLLSVKV